jgi:hypothetical protein
MLSLTLADDRGEIRSSQENLEVELNRADRVPESGVSNVESGIDFILCDVRQLEFLQDTRMQNAKDTDSVILAAEVELDSR